MKRTPRVDRILVFAGAGLSIPAPAGNPGYLADFSASANPYYLTFVLEPGDQLVINNNIPLMHCGVPSVAATKQVVGTPTVLANDATRVTYRVGITSTGSTVVRDAMAVNMAIRKMTASIPIYPSQLIEKVPKSAET